MVKKIGKYITFFYKYYIIMSLIAIDQLVKTLAVGGNPDITISDLVGRKYPNTFADKFINTLFFWEKHHTKKHREPDEELYPQIDIRAVLIFWIIVFLLVAIIRSF